MINNRFFLWLMALDLALGLFYSFSPSSKIEHAIPQTTHAISSEISLPASSTHAYDFLFDSLNCPGLKSIFGKENYTTSVKIKNQQVGIKSEVTQINDRISEVIKCKSKSYSLAEIPIFNSGTCKVQSVEQLTHYQKLTLDYSFIENGKKVQLSTSIFPIQACDLKPGDKIFNQQKIAKVHQQSDSLVIETFFPLKDAPFFKKEWSWYMKEYSVITNYSQEPILLVVEKSNYKIHVFEKGKAISNYDVCLGQSPVGHKVQEGDNKTPEGEYRITELTKGPFYSGTGPYLGDRWMHFSYPNRFDAIRGYERGIITKQQMEQIVMQDKKSEKTNSYSGLGGRVGIHGWINEFTVDGTQNLTWGCICMQNKDINFLFDKIKLNTKLIILP